MKYATVCSGVEAPSVAWEGLGWKPVFFSQFDPEHDYTYKADFPSRVLAHHYPDVPNLGNMLEINGSDYANSIDLVCGGTPCQDFSLAGKRAGMAGSRGNLTLAYVELLGSIKPTWFVWENVPGVLSSNRGRDFGAFLGAVAKLGYGYAYRTLDAQFFGVPQRRRRVFVIGHIGGNWKSPAEVLFEPESLPWNIETGGNRIKANSRKTKSDAGRNSGKGLDWPAKLASKVDANFADKRGCNNQHIANGASLFVMAHGQKNAELIAGQCPALTCNHESPIIFQSKASAMQYMNPSGVALTLDKSKSEGLAVCFSQNLRNEVRIMKVVGALAAQPGMKQTSYLQLENHVRRITPLEAERLQGFPDNYTFIPEKTKTGIAADSPRYKAMGNSMAVPVMRWIGERINKIHNQNKSEL
jgi:DNA (cytosine-5)-methyltransferase 1